MASERQPRLETDSPTIGRVLVDMLRHPYSELLCRWNWKAALTSAVMRGAVFFMVNLGGDPGAARSAFITEFVVRGITSGFYGTMTQSFSAVEPAWVATATAAALMPVLSHSIELLVHWLRGTDRLAVSISASVVFTIGSTAFSLHAMRHGIMTVGEGSQSLMADLRALPALVLSMFGLRTPGAATTLEPPEIAD